MKFTSLYAYMQLERNAVYSRVMQICVININKIVAYIFYAQLCF